MPLKRKLESKQNVSNKIKKRSLDLDSKKDMSYKVIWFYLKFISYQTQHWVDRYPGSLVSNSQILSTNWNMKLVSWNVNGLRASVKEIKCAYNKIPSECKLPSYQTFWCSSKKDGYAGVGVYSKTKPINVSKGLNISKHDNEDVPNSGQGLVRLSYRQKEWDVDFLNYLKKLDTCKPVIVCGDLNVAHEEIDLANPSTNHRSAGFTDEERLGFTELLKNANLIDTYRYFYPDRDKAYTFWSYRSGARATNTGWRLDYFLVSERIISKVTDQEIRCGVHGSDHCPIVLYLKV